MILSNELAGIRRIFIDTAPIIYYIEAHSQFGPVTKEIFQTFHSGKSMAFTSVITITEVLPKPIKIGNMELAIRFMEFLKYGKNFELIEISSDIAEKAGNIRGYYTDLRTMDAIQIATALDIGAEVFITNDTKLKQIKDIRVLVLKDYI